MNESPKYSLTLRISYRRSKKDEYYAEVTWSSISKLPGQAVFGLEVNEELPFEAFKKKYRELAVPRGDIITLIIKNRDNGKSYPFSFHFNEDWQAPDDCGGVIERPGILDITRVIEAIQ